MKYNHYIVAVSSSSPDGIHYAPDYVSGYSVWNVTVDAVTGKLVSVRLRAANCDQPSARAIQNYFALHGAGVL